MKYYIVMVIILMNSFPPGSDEPQYPYIKTVTPKASVTPESGSALLQFKSQ